MKANNEEFAIIMKVYHREKILGNQKISERLFADHGIKMRYDLCNLSFVKISETCIVQALLNIDEGNSH